MVTAQARMANAEFLAFAPPPAGGAGAVCVIDSGLDLNPDTEGSVLERIAIDGGDPGDVHGSKHGTRMAMVIAGPVNDWGGVGFWPYARIISVRAVPPGESGFPFSYYAQAMRTCQERPSSTHLKAINLSLGGSGASDAEIAKLSDRIVQARTNGFNVVAAAGNSVGAVEYPAAIPEAFAVGAGHPTGAFCSFASRGEGLDLVAPGCELDVALADGRRAIGSGSSLSAALTSAALAALRSYRPDLSPVDAEQFLLATARATSAGPTLDVEAAFRAAGLTHIVDAGNGSRPPDTPPRGSDGSDVPAVGPPAGRLPRPRIRSSSYSRGQLTLRLANRPAGAAVVARIVYRASRGEFRHRERASESFASTLRLRPPPSWSRVYVEYRALDLEPSRQVVVTKRRVAPKKREGRRR